MSGGSYISKTKGAYGRVVFLEPATWKNGFPVIGVDADGDGTGEPVLRYKKPNVGKTFPIETPSDSDEFDGTSLGLQWQWHANQSGVWALPDSAAWHFATIFSGAPGKLQEPLGLAKSLTPKISGRRVCRDDKSNAEPRFEGEKLGFVVMGLDYSYLGVTFRNGRLYLAEATAKDADKHTAENESLPITVSQNTMYLRIKVSPGGTLYVEP